MNAAIPKPIEGFERLTLDVMLPAQVADNIRVIISRTPHEQAKVDITAPSQNVSRILAAIIRTHWSIPTDHGGGYYPLVVSLSAIEGVKPEDRIGEEIDVAGNRVIYRYYPAGATTTAPIVPVAGDTPWVPTTEMMSETREVKS